MAKKGLIYRGLKPVYWCAQCGTALAEAEIEYAEDPCDSIYVKFQVTDDKGIFANMGIDKSDVYFVIWTTTTWTLPGNLAICLGPDFDYTLVKANGEYYVMAEYLVPGVMEAAGISEYETVGLFKGADLELMSAAHPFLDRQSLVIVGDHVTLESGTGCVHTAPGFGVEDFDVCKKYPQIEIVVPVDAEGRQTADAGQFAGLKILDSNAPIVEQLKSTGNLFALQKMVHQYPHCWRCKLPVMFRATEQWFCSVDAIKDDAVKAIEDVQWIPEWGEDRIKSMVIARNDWCISRQRRWGVPIPILYCKDCGKSIIDDVTVKAISDLFRAEGSDAWYIKKPAEFLPADYACECGCKEFTQEQDILDVWFDSGVSHTAVMEQNPNLTWPADLYLEGADQYRGWFQSSLLTSVACGRPAPYKAVCTHGWVVDGEGKAMHKSLGNGIDPSEITEQYGADILRLWVASSDYHADIRISKEILKQLSEAYRKIRNTARYILGNLNGFDPNTDRVSIEELTELDKWAMSRLDEVIAKAKVGYDAFDFHVAFHAIHNFCVVDMSSFYLDIIKDRLYCEKKDSVARRAAQTAMYDILSALTRLVAPILVFTAEEIWQHIPACEGLDMESVFYNDMPEQTGITVADPALWETLAAVRMDVQKALELKRASKEIGKSLEAQVVLTCSDELYETLAPVSEMLPDLFIASQVVVEKGDAGELQGEAEGLFVTVVRAEGDKCDRCWKFDFTVGSDAEHPTLCARCAAAVR
ncbi:MAG: isoleucine--tRNA ligase, partial [Oscillospiraceae bacterium]|nr:isoleucine--tRNA ligase [Oscillospiraceae bacterium]